MKRCHTESRKGRRGHKWFPTRGSAKVEQANHLGMLRAIIAAALLDKGR